MPTGQDAGRSIGKAQAGDAKTRHAAQIAGLALVDLWIFVGSVNQCQLFVESHLTQQLIDTRVPCDLGDGLGENKPRSED